MGYNEDCKPNARLRRLRLSGALRAAHDEPRDYFRHRTRMGEVVSLEVRREQFRGRVVDLRTMLRVA